MHLIDFINTTENWREILSAEPYYLTIKEEEPYILLKYSQIESDFDLEEVVDARGCIIKYDKLEGEYVYVCRPFKKFFNYGEPQAAYIDWGSAVITEKVDGSLLKIWNDDDEWHLSTNGSIDAFATNVGDTKWTFGRLFEYITGYNVSYLATRCRLDKTRTYCFELTSLENRVVVPYENGLYYLACFDNKTGQECGLTQYQVSMFIEFGVNLIGCDAAGSLEEVIKKAEASETLKEGFVVCDKYSNRVKVKSSAYLRAAHLFAKGRVSKIDMLQMILEDTVDDFVGYFPEFNSLKAEVSHDLFRFITSTNDLWNCFYKPGIDKKTFALRIRDFRASWFLFKKYDMTEYHVEYNLTEEILKTDYKILAKVLGYKE